MPCRLDYNPAHTFAKIHATNVEPKMHDKIREHLDEMEKLGQEAHLTKEMIHDIINKRLNSDTLDFSSPTYNTFREELDELFDSGVLKEENYTHRHTFTGKEIERLSADLQLHHEECTRKGQERTLILPLFLRRLALFAEVVSACTDMQRKLGEKALSGLGR